MIDEEAQQPPPLALKATPSFSSSWIQRDDVGSVAGNRVGVECVWRDIHYTAVRSSACSRVMRCGAAREGKAILRGISGVARKGELLAILGSSGACEWREIMW